MDENISTLEPARDATSSDFAPDSLARRLEAIGERQVRADAEPKLESSIAGSDATSDADPDEVTPAPEHSDPEPADAEPTAFEDASSDDEAMADTTDTENIDVEDTETDTPAPLGETPPRKQCANCDTPLVGPYCANCGQRAAERIVPLHEMTQEWVEDLFEFDLRIFRTLPTFFFKPGRLTKEYVQGKRVRYVRPLRLYLVASFILFSVLAFSDLATIDTEESEAAVPDSAATAALQQSGATLDSLANAAPAASTNDSVYTRLQSIRETINNRDPDAPLDTAALLGSLRDLENVGQLSETDQANIDHLTQAAVARAMTAETQTNGGSKGNGRSALAHQVADNINISLFDDPQRDAEAEAFVKKRLVQTIEDPNVFMRGMVDRAPYVMFLLLPIFALLLKLLYARRGKLYVQHLIFALHFHALAFLVFAAATGFLITDSATLHTIGGWFLLLPFVYLFIAMHHVYEQGWLKTGIKVTLLLGIYNTFIAIAMVVLAIANFLLL